jgi:hypothetical protein
MRTRFDDAAQWCVGVPWRLQPAHSRSAHSMTMIQHRRDKILSCTRPCQRQRLKLLDRSGLSNGAYLLTGAAASRLWRR